MKRILLVLSAIAFFCLQITTKLFAIGVLVSIPFLLWFAVKRPQLAAPRRMRVTGKAFCLLTAIGTCLWPIESFAGWLRSITVFQRLQAMLGMNMGTLSYLAAALFAIAGLLFTYQMISLFYERLFAIARETIGDFSKTEGITMLVGTLLLMIAVVAVYTRTDAFASATVTRDLIFTSDSGAIVHENAYLSLSAWENDFRSPLFALFAAPLLGIPYLISRFLPIKNALATVMVAAQIPLLAASAWLLMKLIEDVGKPVRILLPVLLLSTYSALLFTVMAEQYTVALFYVALGLYRILKHGKRDQILLLGAAGTMLPGAALSLAPEYQGKKLTAICKDTAQTALWGLVTLCTLGSVGILLRIPATLQSVGRFTGTGISFADKIGQFLSFAGQIFVAPKAGMVILNDGYAKWRLMETGSIDILGIAVLLLACIGFMLNRKQRFAQVSLAWVAVSFLLLCALGWGTAENGLTLYTLYFGWAYAALLIYLIESLCRALKLTRFSWVLYGLGIAVLLVVNVPPLLTMVRFAITNYPL